MAGNDGVINPTPTLLSEIHFYAGVKLDPLEQKWYIPNPPSGTDLSDPISSWLTRAIWEQDVLFDDNGVSLEVTDLEINPSSYQNIGKQIYSPQPLSSFQLTNVNFVKVINKDEVREKVFYGFVTSVSYSNDGDTIVDWAESTFYTSLFNGIEFGNSTINRAHIPLYDGDKTLDEIQIKLPENISAGNSLINALSYELLPSTSSTKREADIRWVVIEYFVGQIGVTATSTGGGSPFAPSDETLLQERGVNIGYSTQRGYITIPFVKKTSTDSNAGYPLDIINANGTRVTNYQNYNTGNGTGIASISQLMGIVTGGFTGNSTTASSNVAWYNNGNSIGQSNIVYNIGMTLGVDYEYDQPNKAIRMLTTADKRFVGVYNTLYSAGQDSTNSVIMPMLYQSEVATAIINDSWIPSGNAPSNSFSTSMPTVQQDTLWHFIYNYFLKYSYNGYLQNFFGTRGGIPEKLSQYVGFNFMDADSLIGYFTIEDCIQELNDTADVGKSNSENNFRVEIKTSPHQAARIDVTVLPYSRNDSGTVNDGVLISRKFSSQRSSSFPIVENTWANYSYLNQNQMANSLNVIQTSQQITESQNNFSNDQTHAQQAYNVSLQKQDNQLAMNYTTTTANQQYTNNYQSTVGGMLSNTTGSALSGGSAASVLGNIAGSTLADSPSALWSINVQGATQRSQQLQNQANQNAINSYNTNFTAGATNQLADNTKTFNNKIAAATAQMQKQSVYAGWNDMKLQPATVVSGGSQSEYLAHMDWDYPYMVLSVPTLAQMLVIGRYLMEYGNAVNVFGNPQPLFFTRKVCNFISCDDCNIVASSNIENNAKIAIEAALVRGVQIWHDLTKMTNNDFTGNDYSGLVSVGQYD